MADEIKTGKPQKKTEEREDIFIPRGLANDDPNLEVYFNGKSYIMPKGKTSNVPKCVAEEIRRAWKAEEKRLDRADELAELGKEPSYKI